MTSSLHLTNYRTTFLYYIMTTPHFKMIHTSLVSGHCLSDVFTQFLKFCICDEMLNTEMIVYLLYGVNIVDTKCYDSYFSHTTGNKCITFVGKHTYKGKSVIMG